MTSFRSDKADPITSKAQLIATLADGSKPASAWRIGTEHEKFPFDKATLRPVAYDAANGIREILTGLTRFGWEPVNEGPNVISLAQKGMGTISLEPGGQMALAGGPDPGRHRARRLHFSPSPVCHPESVRLLKNCSRSMPVG